MKISISNIAWEVSDDELVLQKLLKNNLKAIDIAPMKYFPEPLKTNYMEITKVRHWWNSKGIEIVGMQSLLFGTSGLNLFGSFSVQKLMLEHLEHICRIGRGLGAKYLVFGSPKNRDRNGLSDDEVSDISIPFFRKLGDIASKYNVEICIEANPTIYGANFITTSEEAANFVEKVNHPNVKMQLDTGTIIVNNENLESILINYSHLIGHIHASESNLMIYGVDNSINLLHGKLIKKYLPNHFVTIEMLKSANDSNYDAIETAIKTAQRCFN